MIEVYVALSLLSLGYILNQNKTVLSPLERKVDPNDLPSQNNIHESHHTKTVKKNEEKQGHEAYQKSLDHLNTRPGEKNVIPQYINKNYGVEKNEKSLRQDNNGKNMVYSPLLGKHLSPQEFTHNNMVHFIKPKNEVSENPDALQSKLETFTGISQHFKPKHETPSFFTPQKDMNFVSGTPHAVDFQQERIPVPVSHNNVTPFKQEKVARGLGLGFTTEGSGGFHQFDAQNFAKPKTVDELRVKSNPKVTYEGRVIEGQKGSERGKVGKLAKNRVDRFFKNTPDMYLKTTGAYLKPKQHPKYNAKATHRQDTSVEYGGIAFDGSKQNRFKSSYRDPLRQQLDRFNKGHANVANQGKGELFDHGKKNIMVYANERDTTAEKTYQGNVTSLFKAFIAPFEDVFRFNKKEYMVDNPRHYGQMGIQIPSKSPAYDPNDVARTTVKETTLNQSEKMNLKGYQKGVVYDPNDIARTTIKETTLNEAEKTNLKGPVKAFVYDPNDIARTTIKETTLNEAEKMNLRGYKKGVVYDPNDIARTTIKETTLNEAEKMNLYGYKKGAVYDPNDIARTTIKETTLQDNDNNKILQADQYANTMHPDDDARVTIRETTPSYETTMNLLGEIKNYVYDPNDVAKTTIKETMIDNDHLGNVEGFIENRGEYRDNNYQVKETHKQYLSDHDYAGQIDGNQNADGYKLAPRDVKNTAKQFTSDHEYYGSTGDKLTHRLMSYDDIYNAEIDDRKEVTLERREPVSQGAKVAIGADAINLDTRQNELAYEDIFERQFDNKERMAQMSQERLPISIDSVTRLPRESQRIDERLLSSKIDHINNPYVISII